MHIVFLILKIIGIILLVLLGILLFFMVVVLFAPLKYKIEGSYHGHARFSLRASWLFHLLRIKAAYVPEDGLEWQVNFAWIKRPKPDAVKNADAGEEEPSLQMMEVEADEDEKASAQKVVSKEPAVQKNRKAEAETRKKLSWIGRMLSGIRNRIVEFGERIKRIKYTFRNICDKIKHVKDKKDAVLDFLQDKQNQKIFYYIWNQIQFILQKLRPRKCYIKGVLGFEDPALTGQVFGGIAILYAWVGQVIQVVPDFEEETIDLDFLIKGHFRIIYVLIAGMRLMMDRETRRFLMKMKKQFL